MTFTFEDKSEMYLINPAHAREHVDRWFRLQNEKPNVIEYIHAILQHLVYLKKFGSFDLFISGGDDAIFQTIESQLDFKNRTGDMIAFIIFTYESDLKYLEYKNSRIRKIIFEEKATSTTEYIKNIFKEKYSS